MEKITALKPFSQYRSQLTETRKHFCFKSAFSVLDVMRAFNQILPLLSLLFLHISLSIAFPDSILRILPESQESLPHHHHRKIPRDDNLYCDSWRLTVETNDAGPWTRIPSRCVAFVQDYVTGDRYRSDSEAVADASLAFAKTVKLSGDGKDAWVFDIDETLLSNVPYYAVHGFGLVKQI